MARRGKLRLHKRFPSALAAERARVERAARATQPDPAPSRILPASPGLASLPEARPSDTGKTCRCCKQAKPYKAFPANKRTCQDCRDAGLRPVFQRMCTVCGNDFDSYSQKASYCSEPCVKTGVNQTRRDKYAERISS